MPDCMQFDGKLPRSSWYKFKCSLFSLENLINWMNSIREECRCGLGRRSTKIFSTLKPLNSKCVVA